ncbi:MAG: hypothetical protein M0R49_02380 [Limnochordia bacterium]|nr:hypothetical protein [Limnochordia bacterium]
MDSIIGGVLLAIIGAFLSFITYKQANWFWSFINTRILRKYLGDTVASITLYSVSMVLIVVGVLLAVGLIH